MQSFLNVPDENKRFLTGQEIESILLKFPRKSTPGLQSSQISSEIEYLKPLIKILTVPNKDGIVDEVEDIIRQYYLGQEYILISGHDENASLVPRYLSNEEIEMILSEFPATSGAATESSRLARLSLIDNLRSQLQTIKIVPHPNAIKELIRTIDKFYSSALMSPGDVVNTVCADAIGSTATQMTLDTFKLAGALHSIGSGVQGLINLIYAINKLDAPCSVHFNVIVNAKDVFDMRAIIVDVKVMDIVLPGGHDIFFRKGVSDIPQDATVLEENWWHSTYFRINGTPSSDYRNILRLRFDTKKMFEHRITMKMVIKTFDQSGSGVFICVPSPFSTGILDVYLNETQAKYLLGPVGQLPGASIIYLNSIVKGGGDKNNPALNKRRIKGIPGITDLYAVETTTTSLILSSNKINIRQRKTLESSGIRIYESLGVNADTFYSRSYKVYIDKKQEKQTGLDLNRLITLFQQCDMNIFGTEKDLAGTYTSFYIYVPTGKSPDATVNEYVSNNKEDPYIQGLHKYTSAMTVGSNLIELLKIPWINKKKTTMSNAGEINKIFGCESARSFSVHELVRIMDINKIVINSRHITLIADFIFCKGVFRGMTYHHIKTHGGPMSVATVERSMQSFANYAPYSKKESALTLSVSVAIGSPPPIGSNYHMALTSKKSIDIYKQKLIDEIVNKQNTMNMKGVSTKRNAGRKVIRSISSAGLSIYEDATNQSTPPLPTPSTGAIVPESKISSVFEIIPIDDDGNPLIEEEEQRPIPYIISNTIAETINDVMRDNPVKGFRVEASPDIYIQPTIEEVLPPGDTDQASYSVPSSLKIRRSFRTGIPLDVLPANRRPMKIKSIPRLAALDYNSLINTPETYTSMEYDLDQLSSYLEM